jgi:hypothetical protein
MSRRHRKCCCEPCCEPCWEPCCKPCCEPCYVPCRSSVGYGGLGGFGGGNLCWIIIAIAIFWVLCKKDKDNDNCYD